MKKILFILIAIFCFSENKAQVLNSSFCQTNGNVLAVAVDSVNNVVYIGGSFTQVCGVTRKYIAAMNLTTGALLPFNPAANNSVEALYIHHNALYVGGVFTVMGGQAHKFAAKFYIPSGTLTTWNPAFTTGNFVNSIAGRGNYIYMGGNFLLTVSTGNNLCELDTATAAASNWAPANLNGNVQALSIAGNELYVAGQFTNMGPSNLSYLGKISLPGGSVSSWNPAPDAVVSSVLVQSGRVFIGGVFLTIGTDNRSYLAEVDSATGLATPWNPNPDGGVSGMAYRNGMLYTFGAFNNIGTKARTSIAAVNVNTGIASNWNISLGNQVSQAATTPSQIYLGGNLSTVLGQLRSNFAVVCINPIDTITNAPVGPTTICAGVNSISYSVAPVTGATSYVWSYSGTGAIITGTSNVVSINFSASATSGTLTVKATNGCENSNTLGLPINTYTFTTTVTPASSSIACGDSTDINSGDNYLGSGSVTYSWSPATGLASTNNIYTTTGTKITRTYTLTETSTEGCVAKDFVTITVNPYNLSTSSASSFVLCANKDSLHVTNDYIGYGTVSYTWSPVSSLNASNAANVEAGPVTNTDYTVTSSASDGCAAAPQIITVNVQPVFLSLGSNPTTITCGDAAQLSAGNNYPGAGTLTYTWSPSTALSNTHITNPIANPIATTDYTLTMNSPEGCVSTDHTTINVNSLQINTAGTMSTTCHALVALSTSANSSNPGLTYSWTPSAGLSSTTAASPNAAVYSNSTFNVTMSLPSSGCAPSNNSVNIVLTAPATPQICMVTVDSASTHNIVYWDKTGFSGASIDSFRIYREISTFTYGIVGTVHYNSLSEFHDYGANPNVTTYRYKISAVDSCGLESPLSPYHNTIYIAYVGGGQYSWTTGYTIEPSINPVANYLLMRDDNNTGSWHQIQTTSGTSNIITDPTYLSFPNANWQVATSWSLTCTPTLRQSNGTQAAIVKSKSNISNNRASSVKNIESNFSVYPNPTNGNLTIAFANTTTGKTTVKITSVLGQDVYNETFVASEKHNVDLSKYENGIYLVQITTNNSTLVKRIVKN